MSEPVRSIADFLAIVRKSGLVEESRLAEAVAAWTDLTADLPDELPQALIDAELLTHWQVDQLRKGKHKGFMLGKYRLLRLLGAGGMSSVYLAENTTLKQRVAIKVLPLKRVEQSSFLARFEREAQAAFRLGHQNIARAFDLDTAGSVHFIVMEYVDGIDLHAKVKQDGPLEIRDAVDYLRQAAVGLHYAHGEGLVHRDIKPANLILDRKGVVRILDLGLALAGDDDKQASLTREHDEKVLGTADYLAPEQASDSHKADRRADIYALGCTLHYLLVGRIPSPKASLPSGSGPTRRSRRPTSLKSVPTCHRRSPSSTFGCWRSIPTPGRRLPRRWRTRSARGWRRPPRRRPRPQQRRRAAARPDAATARRSGRRRCSVTARAAAARVRFHLEARSHGDRAAYPTPAAWSSHRRRRAVARAPGPAAGNRRGGPQPASRPSRATRPTMRGSRSHVGESRSSSPDCHWDSGSRWWSGSWP